jgi:hypothetical protein
VKATVHLLAVLVVTGFVHYYYYYYYYYYYCHRPFLPGTSPLEVTMIHTAQASNFGPQYLRVMLDIGSVECFPNRASKVFFKLFVLFRCFQLLPV